MSTALENLQRHLRNQSQGRRRAVEQRDECQKELKACHSREGECLQQVDRQTGEIDTLTARQQRHAAEMEALTKLQQKYEDEFRHCTEKMDREIENYKDLLREHNDMQTEHRACTHQLREQTRQVGTLTESNNNLAAELQACRAALDAANAQVEDQHKLLHAAKRTIGQQQAKITELRADVAAGPVTVPDPAVIEGWKRCRDELQDLQRLLDECKTDRAVDQDRWKRQTDEMKTRNRQLETDVETLRGAVEAANRENQRLQQDVVRLGQELDNNRDALVSSCRKELDEGRRLLDACEAERRADLDKQVVQQTRIKQLETDIRKCRQEADSEALKQRQEMDTLQQQNNDAKRDVDEMKQTLVLKEGELKTCKDAMASRPVALLPPSPPPAVIKHDDQAIRAQLERILTLIPDDPDDAEPLSEICGLSRDSRPHREWYSLPSLPVA